MEGTHYTHAPMCAPSPPSPRWHRNLKVDLRSHVSQCLCSAVVPELPDSNPERRTTPDRGMYGSWIKVSHQITAERLACALLALCSKAVNSLTPGSLCCRLLFVFSSMPDSLSTSQGLGGLNAACGRRWKHCGWYCGADLNPLGVLTHPLLSTRAPPLIFLPDLTQDGHRGDSPERYEPHLCASQGVRGMRAVSNLLALTFPKSYYEDRGCGTHFDILLQHHGRV
jgi:hypothetical protein